MTDRQEVHPNLDLTALIRNVGGRGEILAVLVDHVLLEFPKKINELEKALAASDPDLLRMVAHALKSPLASFGAEKARGLAAELEKCGETGRLEPAAALLPALAVEIDRIVGYFSSPKWREDLGSAK